MWQPKAAARYYKDSRYRRDWVGCLRRLPRPAAALGLGSVGQRASPEAAFSPRIFALPKGAHRDRFPTLDCSDFPNLASVVSLILIVSARFQVSLGET